MPHYEADAVIRGEPQKVFDRLDDQAKLAAHMTKGSPRPRSP